jgi:hypothetical protein
MEPLRILTWHVHGSYLDSLIRTGHSFFLPVATRDGERIGGIGGWNWSRDRVHEVPAELVRDLDVDLVLYQSRENWLDDGPRILSEDQLRGPRIYVEHNPPWADPTDERHPVDDPDVLLVHVTAFNRLMWDAGGTPTLVIEHGVPEPTVAWTGDRARGLAVINDLARRDRRFGRDVFDAAREELPIDLVGMRSELVGGLGEVPRRELPRFSAPYRFFFHPARYTSFGMAVVEAMLLGMPVVALATTEMPSVLENGRSGIVHTEPAALIEGARELLHDRDHAARLGAAGRAIALERFGIDRFVHDWNEAFRLVIGGPAVRRPAAARGGRATEAIEVPA